VGGPGGLSDISWCSRTFLDTSLALSGPFRVLGKTPKMAIFGYFWGQTSCLDPLEGPQSGVWAQVSLVGGPGGLWDISGCSRTFLDISLALSGPFRVIGETPQMAILGYFWGQNSCLDPLEGLPSGFWTQISLVGGPGSVWDISGCYKTFLGISLALSGPFRVLGETPKMAILGYFWGQNSCLDPLEGLTSGFWTQVSLVGGPGSVWDISGCYRTFIGISLASSGPSHVLGETPQMTIFGPFGGQNSCLTP
jgi:hypothetical protein